MEPEVDLLLSVKKLLKSIQIPVYDLGQQRPEKFPQIIVYLQNEQEITDLKVMDCVKATIGVDVYVDITQQGKSLMIGRKVANLMQRLKLSEWPLRYSDYSMRPIVDTSLQSRTLYRLAFLFDYFIYGKKG